MVFKLFAIGIYVAILIGIGVAASRRTKDLRDYYAGGKRMGFLAVAFSARATGESAWLLLGLTGFGAAFGVKGFWVVAGEVLGVGLAWLLMSRRFKRLTDRYDSITVPDYLESRLADSGHGLRLIAAVALLVFVPIYVSAQIHATGRAFDDFLGWNYYAGALTGFLVVVGYIVRGGFVAVVWSDVFQGTLMVIALVALPIVGVAVAGGPGPLIETLQRDYPTLLSPTGGDGLSAESIASIIGLLAIGIGFLGSPQVFVRFISLRSESEIPRGAFVAIAWTVLADSSAVLGGIVGRALLEGDLGTGSEAVLPIFVETFLPAFVVGLYVAVVLSAIMSTIDSLLVVASSAAVRDTYQKIWHPDLPDDGLLRLSRRLTIALAVAALLIAFAVAASTKGQGIFWFVIFGWSGIAATFCPTIILSLFWSRLTARGAMAAMIAGFAAVPFFKFAAPGFARAGPLFAELGELAPAFVVSALVGVVVSLFDRRGQAALGGDPLVGLARGDADADP